MAYASAKVVLLSAFEEWFSDHERWLFVVDFAKGVLKSYVPPFLCVLYVIEKAVALYNYCMS